MKVFKAVKCFLLGSFVLVLVYVTLVDLKLHHKVPVSKLNPYLGFITYSTVGLCIFSIINKSLVIPNNEGLETRLISWFTENAAIPLQSSEGPHLITTDYNLDVQLQQLTVPKAGPLVKAFNPRHQSQLLTKHLFKFVRAKVRKVDYHQIKNPVPSTFLHLNSNREHRCFKQRRKNDTSVQVFSDS